MIHVLRLRRCARTKSEVGAINGQRFHSVHHHQRSDHNLYSVVKLRFPIREKHFRTGDRQLSLKCTASVIDLYWRSTEVKMLIRPQHGWMFTTSNRAHDTVGLQDHFRQQFMKFVLVLAMMYFL